MKVRPGSGILRGYCRMCDGLTCGRRGCMSHNPLEKQIEAEERADYLQRVRGRWM